MTAACVTGSLRAGAPTRVDTAYPTSMAGLNCGTVSTIAWPAISRGLDAGVGVSDAETAAALMALHVQGLFVGPCGAAALAGLQAAATVDGLRARALDTAATMVLISTEGIDANHPRQ